MDVPVGDDAWEDLRSYATALRCKFVKVVADRTMVPYYGDDAPGCFDFFDVFHAWEKYRVDVFEHKGCGRVYLLRGTNAASDAIAVRRGIFYAEPFCTYGGM